MNIFLILAAVLGTLALLAGSLGAHLWQDLLTDSDVDAVFITTRHNLHGSLTIEALRANKHVFVEKPLASSVKDAAGLVEKAERRGLSLMVGHTFEYSPPVRKIDSLIKSGDLGEHAVKTEVITPARGKLRSFPVKK